VEPRNLTLAGVGNLRHMLPRVTWGNVGGTVDDDFGIALLSGDRRSNKRQEGEDAFHGACIASGGIHAPSNRQRMEMIDQ
jgi:hypothetical protein